jgi:DNA ligase-1
MEFKNLFSDLRGTSKPSEKQEVLLQHDSPELRELLRLTYDPFTLFNVSIKPKEIPAPGEYDLGAIFDQAEAVFRFCEGSKSAKQNREMVIALLEKLNFGSQELLVGILNKNWKVGISSKAVLKWLPGLIKQFNVQLANTYDPNNEKHQLQRWLLSYKLDGLRCVALRESSDEYYDKGLWTLFSRKGKEFLTVNHLKPQLEALYRSTGKTFFDGELYKHGLSFEEIQGPVMAYTKGQVPDMEYHVFVSGAAKKFLVGADPNHVEAIDVITDSEAPHIKGTSLGLIYLSEVASSVEEAFEQGYEGVMLRDPDNLYDYKRSNALLKLKRSLLEEMTEQSEVISDCIITRIEYKDDFPVIEDGKLHTERLLNKVWVMQENGIESKVGSGYSLDFRRKYTEKPWELIGMNVEVKHQGWGANGRMRFGRLFRIREDL